MTREPLISVIVPVYNAGEYLDPCLESIVAQSYRHLEIIVVDDGSTDGSSEKCDHWAERDKRIRVIHQPNGGHSAARNTALDSMTGQLVTMVDSDDVLHPDFTATLLDVMQRTSCDIAVGRYVPFDSVQPLFPADDANAPLRQYNQHEAMLAVFYQQGLDHSPWGRIFRASLFEQVRFPMGIIYEDLAIIYPLLKQCTSVAVIDRVLYGYRQHDDSSMKVFSPRRAAVLDVCEQLEKTMQDSDQQYLKAVRSRALSAYFNILLLSRQDVKDDHKRLQERCWAGIKRLRRDCLVDPHVRKKNKLGIMASYLGRWFLCSVIGRNYRPKP